MRWGQVEGGLIKGSRDAQKRAMYIRSEQPAAGGRRIRSARLDGEHAGGLGERVKLRKKVGQKHQLSLGAAALPAYHLEEEKRRGGRGGRGRGRY